MMPFPKKELVEVLKNLNKKHNLDKRFRKSELTAAEYCDQSHAILKMRALNIAALIVTGTACAAPYLMDHNSALRESALFIATTTIATVAAFNFAFENFKDIYFDNIKNGQFFKTRIIDETVSNMNKHDIELMGKTLNSSELHNALIWGNELHGTKTGYIIEKTKKIVASIQDKWSTSKFNIWKENKTEIEDLIVAELLRRKEGINNIIKELYNPDSKENKMIKESQRKSYGSDSNNDDFIQQEIKKINKIAIRKATELYNNQAIELVFLKVVADFDKGIKHTGLLMMLKDLSTSHVYKNKEDKKMLSYTNFNKISNYANEMLGGINVLEHRDSFKPKMSVADIAKKINPNLVSNDNKIKFVNYTNLLINQKEAIINNFTNVKKPKINEVAINKLDLDKILAIKHDQDQAELDRKAKLDEKLKVHEILDQSKRNRNIRS